MSIRLRCQAARTRYTTSTQSQNAPTLVPGTAAEHGAWKQFNAMFSRDTASGFNDFGGLSPAQSEGYIQTLKLTFTHPGTGQQRATTVIGLKEGNTAFPWPASLHMQNNVAWWEDDPNDPWRIYLRTDPRRDHGEG